MFDCESAATEILYLISILGNWVGVIGLIMIGIGLILIAREMKHATNKSGRNRKNK